VIADNFSDQSAAVFINKSYYCCIDAALQGQMATPVFYDYTFVSAFEAKLGRLCLSACTSVAYTSAIGVPIGFN